MTIRLRMLAGGIAAAVIAAGIYASGPREFRPDTTFKGSALTGWRPIGQAGWKAANGEIVATPGSGSGWLVLNQNYQDVQFFANIRCTAGSKAGVLLRAAKTPDGGLSGIFVSLASGELGFYSLTLDAQGKEVSRTAMKAPPARPSSSGQPRPTAGWNATEWNEFMVIASAYSLRSTVNGAAIPVSPLQAPRADTKEGGAPPGPPVGFGAIALYAGGDGEVRFKDVAWKDLMSLVEPREITSTHFTRQLVNQFWYGWGPAVADFNKDGIPDIAVGNFYYLGPNYTTRRIYREDRGYNPATEYPPDMVPLAYDWTGDGWPDILATDQGFWPMALYVNPKGESRRWERRPAIPDVRAEIVAMADIDGDKVPEVFTGSSDGYVWCKYDPKNPNAEWAVHHISRGGRPPGHGVGVADINGDGRLDLIGAAGWYEQPAGGPAQENWTYHKEDFGAGSGFLPGGALMGVYDVNGDGLPDVVTSLSAHTFGLAWFEQKREGGKISFVRHMIAGDYSDKNAGGVTFSEPHATEFADMDGDGIPDMIVGKSVWHHHENYNGPDPYGPAVLYVYRTVRNPKAPGGAEFVPELVNNRSGVGSSLAVLDLNKDGAMDIVTTSVRGVFIFWGKPGKWAPAAPGSGTPR